MSAAIGLAAGYAMLVWWFTTGIILFLDGLPTATFRRSMAGASALTLAALVLLRTSALETSAGGAFAAFSAAVVVWGWLEMSFLMGFITGPQRQSYFGPRGTWRHFQQATRAIIHNELAILAAAALIVGLTRQAPNHVGLWTFLVLWSMRLSAKLNLFFGVPNTGEMYLPEHLRYLKTYFNKRRMNLLFPISILGSTIALVVLVQRLLAAEDAFHVAGLALVASLLALAILEHWFMVLPIPTEKLWQWGLRGAASRAGRGTTAAVDVPRIVVKTP
jgi:putative photosynthetic complex assembly protein 2